jgi:hypothetical protein
LSKLGLDEFLYSPLSALKLISLARKQCIVLSFY